MRRRSAICGLAAGISGAASRVAKSESHAVVINSCIDPIKSFSIEHRAGAVLAMSGYPGWMLHQCESMLFDGTSSIKVGTKPKGGAEERDGLCDFAVVVAKIRHRAMADVIGVFHDRCDSEATEIVLRSLATMAWYESLCHMSRSSSLLDYAFSRTSAASDSTLDVRGLRRTAEITLNRDAIDNGKFSLVTAGVGAFFKCLRDTLYGDIATRLSELPVSTASQEDIRDAKIVGCDDAACLYPGIRNTFDKGIAENDLLPEHRLFLFPKNDPVKYHLSPTTITATVNSSGEVYRIDFDCTYGCSSQAVLSQSVKAIDASPFV